MTRFEKLLLKMVNLRNGTNYTEDDYVAYTSEYESIKNVKEKVYNIFSFYVLINKKEANVSK